MRNFVLSKQTIKIGDLLTKKDIPDQEMKPLLVVLGVEKHPNNPERDRIHLQWMPRNGGELINGTFSRLITEKTYKVI